MKLDIPSQIEEPVTEIDMEVSIEEMIDDLNKLHDNRTTTSCLNRLTNISTEDVDASILDITTNVICGKSITTIEDMDEAMREQHEEQVSIVDKLYAKAFGFYKKMYDNNRVYISRVMQYSTTIEQLPQLNNESIPKASPEDSIGICSETRTRLDAIAESLSPVMLEQDINSLTFNQWLNGVTNKLNSLNKVIVEKSNMLELLNRKSEKIVTDIGDYLDSSNRDVSILEGIYKELIDQSTISNTTLEPIYNESSESTEYLASYMNKEDDFICVDPDSLVTEVLVLRLVNSGAKITVLDGRVHDGYLPTISLKNSRKEHYSLSDCKLIPRNELSIILKSYITLLNTCSMYIKAIETIELPITKKVNTNIEHLLQAKLLDTEHDNIDKEQLTQEELCVINDILRLYRSYMDSSTSYLVGQTVIVATIEHYKQAIEEYLLVSIDEIKAGRGV